jgi:outer membrane immunogenic protein
MRAPTAIEINVSAHGLGDRTMKFKLIGAGVAAMAVLAASFSAEAADIPRPVYKGPIRPAVAYYNWTGFYLGINGGYGWGTSDWTSLGVNIVSSKPKGWMIGGTLGYNYQVGSFVWGIEADLDWADVKSSDACLLVLTCDTKNSYLGTIRGRIGYAFDRWLPYFTGGGAYGDINASIPGLGLSATKSQFGWTVGGGLEYAFLGNWSAKLEYLYVDLGSFDTGFAAPATSVNVNFKENIVRAGLNYKFSGPIFSRW